MPQLRSDWCTEILPPSQLDQAYCPKSPDPSQKVGSGDKTRVYMGKNFDSESGRNSRGGGVDVGGGYAPGGNWSAIWYPCSL